MSQTPGAGVGDDRRPLPPDQSPVTPGVGGAAIELQMKVGRVNESPNSRYCIAAELDVSCLSHQGRRRLCRLQAGHLITPTVRPTSFSLHGFVSDEQLRVVEELRAGGDLLFNLTLDVWTVDDPAGLTGYV